MHKQLIEQNYKLIPSEEIPDCCISCCYSEYAFKKEQWKLVCLLSINGQFKEPRVCNFGVCDKYFRRKDLI